MTLKDIVQQKVTDAFVKSGYDSRYGTVSVSKRPDLGDYQNMGSLTAAKEHKENPLKIAEKIIEHLKIDSAFRKVTLESGFINLTLSDTFLIEHTNALSGKKSFAKEDIQKESVIIDFGGANIAKPLHVGHLRSAIIGESLQQLARYLGHTVVSDIHLGDWGLQMGMVITELKRRQPELVYFQEDYTGPFPKDPPFTIEDLDEIYPAASKRAKEDEAAKEEARIATAQLQKGKPGYRALWQHIVDVSTADLKKDYAQLNVTFDLWNGESTVADIIPGMIKTLKKEGYTTEHEGALIIELSSDSDKRKLPPFILQTSHGAELYATTDLATIMHRIQHMKPDTILHVVDNRQSLHFEQLFLTARKTKIAPEALKLEHIGFGTVNGKDGKPFKTREGGVMKLKDLIAMIVTKAQERMAEIKISKDFDETEQKEVARMVGIAAIKFADLINYRLHNYIFDLDRFSSFQGKTGPYILYTAVRIKSILRNAKEKGIERGEFLPPKSDYERKLLLKIAEFPEILSLSFDKRAPNYLSEYVYALALSYNSFYTAHHILHEENMAQKKCWIALCVLLSNVFETGLSLLGIETPQRM